MFENYSGTYFSALTMLAVSILAKFGLSTPCANEAAGLVVPALVSTAIIVARYFKGGINILGKKTAQ